MPVYILMAPKPARFPLDDQLLAKPFGLLDQLAPFRQSLGEGGSVRADRRPILARSPNDLRHFSSEGDESRYHPLQSFAGLRKRLGCFSDDILLGFVEPSGTTRFSNHDRFHPACRKSVAMHIIEFSGIGL